MGRCYPHLSLEERRRIDKWREAKMPVPEIADRLGRAPSAIYRELKRNTYEDKELPELNGYYCVTAQAKYEQRRAIHRKMIVHPELTEVIEDRLKAGWSPEQIAGRMRLERHPIRVSHETIYRFAYSKDGRDEQFYRHLPDAGRVSHSPTPFSTRTSASPTPQSPRTSVLAPSWNSSRRNRTRPHQRNAVWANSVRYTS